MRKVSVSAVLVMLMLCSCRTYGGYGTEQATLVAIEQANRLFAESLDRASRDGQTLDQLAGTDPGLAPFAERYNVLLDRHQRLVMRHAQSSSDLNAGFGSYRKLKTVYDEIVAEQRTLDEAYGSFATSLQSHATGLATRDIEQIGSRYYAAPPFYSRVEGQVTARSVADVLASLQAARSI